MHSYFFFHDDKTLYFMMHILNCMSLLRKIAVSRDSANPDDRSSHVNAGDAS